jgi:hypothetical protein
VEDVNEDLIFMTDFEPDPAKPDIYGLSDQELLAVAGGVNAKAAWYGGPGDGP